MSSIWKCMVLVAVPICIVTVLSLSGPASVLALGSYAGATGQACAACHIDPAGGGALTGAGQAFANVSTHASDPAGAWAQAMGIAAPAAEPAPPEAAPEEPAAE